MAASTTPADAASTTPAAAATAAPTPAAAVLGRCKWFDERKGYGFIVLCEGASAGTDAFVHHRDIVPAVSTRRVLRKGEYVSLRLTEKEPGRPHAVEVRGAGGGPLMCDHFSRRAPAGSGRSPGSSPAAPPATLLDVAPA